MQVLVKSWKNATKQYMLKRLHRLSAVISLKSRVTFVCRLCACGKLFHGYHRFGSCFGMPRGSEFLVSFSLRIPRARIWRAVVDTAVTRRIFCTGRH